MIKRLYTYLISAFFLIISFQAGAFARSMPENKRDTLRVESRRTINPNSPWVNHEFRRLGRRKRIAQLFMVAAYSNQSEHFSDSVGKLIRKYQPGGIIFFQGGPVRESLLLNQYQKDLRVKALVAIDAEWGLAMRLDSTLAYPYQMTLGAIREDSLLQIMGQQIGNQLKRIGVGVNFAPVLDINNNIRNTVINFRSFGESREKVAEKGTSYMLGLQKARVMATAKHFPGHGDTEVDSHNDLPSLPFTRARLDSLELYPFKKAIAMGLGGMMMAHMNVPAMDTSLHLPSSLSGNVIKEVLVKNLGFQGLSFTDAMNMKGVLKYFPVGEAEQRAIMAGNDMVEMSTDLKKSLKLVRKAVRRGILSRKELDERCRKILAWKEWVGMDHYVPVNPDHLIQDLNDTTYQNLIQVLSDKALTFLIGKDSSLNSHKKIKNESPKNGVIISINAPNHSLLDSGLVNAKHLPLIQITKEISQKGIDSLKKLLQGYDYGMILIHDKRLRPGANLGFKPALIQFLKSFIENPEFSVTLMANPYTMAGMEGIEKAREIILTYQDSPFTEKSALKFWMGKLKSEGRLPVSIPGKFNAGEGLELKKQ